MLLSEIIKERILILDGAMGTMIQSYHLEEQDYRGERFKELPGQRKGNNDLLVLTNPDIIADIHRRYLEVGADIIETNTFNSQRISMTDYHCESYCRELNLAAARLARRLADEYTLKTPDKLRFVAGSVGPTNKTCSMGVYVDDPARRDVTFDNLVKAYKEQITALIEGGVDAILVETIFDTLNAKAAVFAAEQCMDSMRKYLPIMLSVTIAEKPGRTLSGQTIDAFLASVSHINVFSIGLNCSFGASDMKPFLKELAAKAPCYISAYPNAGLPNTLGQYDQTPEEMAKEVRTFIDEGLVNIIGGCCGTTDAFIAQYPHLVCRDGVYRKPHVPFPPEKNLTLSGLDVLEIKKENNFINVGERCNVAGSRKFLRLIQEKKYDEAVEIARKQIEDGAQILDINMDDGLLATCDEMVHFINLLSGEPEIARVPFMIDSSDWSVISAALKCIQGKCIVNSISLKEGEALFMDHARELCRYGAAVVVMAFDEKGQADTYERRIEICQRAYRLLTEKVGMAPHDIIFDPNVLAICTGMPEHDSYAWDFIRATHWIHQNLPGVHVSGGISNLSFSFRGNNFVREAMHAVFLYHAIKHGLDMGIVNPSVTVKYDDIPAPLLELLEDVILNRKSSSGKLIEEATKMQNGEIQRTVSSMSDSWRSKIVEQRLRYALVNGVNEYIEEDLTEALSNFPSAIAIIEGPLMEAMNYVGNMFGEGKLFLPQVVKTARTMQKAVGFLQPYIEVEKKEGNKAGKVVLATVKGDVHDIGKNIVSVILSCNNYEVVDIGVMCPATDIVEAVLREKPNFVGLSGLITPSLDEMIHTVQTLKNSGISIPVVLGGATTSLLHTALKIAPVYDGPVIWVKDASQMVLVAPKLMNKAVCHKYIDSIKREQCLLREEYESKQDKIVSFDEARRNKLHLF